MHHPDSQWYRYCRIMLEWLHPMPEFDLSSWVDEVVTRAQSLNVDTLAFDFAHGGYAVFEGSVAEKDRHVGDADLFGLLDRAVHQHGMRLVAMNMGQHCARYASEEYPMWRMRDAAGNEAPFFTSHRMCINTPFANYLLQELARLLSRYQIDGFYIEGLYGLDCFCAHCCAGFERQYGYSIPREPDAQRRDPHYRRYRADVLTRFVRRLRRVIDETSPETVLIPGSFSLEWDYCDLAAWGQHADAIELERQWGYERQPCPLYELGMTMQIIRAESRRSPMGTCWLGWNVDRDYAPSTPAHYRLAFMELLMHGGTPQLHAQTIFDVDRSGMEVVREMYTLLEKARPTLLDAEPVPFAALVIDWTDFTITDHLKGFYRALLEQQVPFRILSRRDLCADKLDQYKVLVFADTRHLTDEEVAAVHAFHQAGGGVVFTGRTGLHRPDGAPRPALPFSDIAGIAGPYDIIEQQPVPGCECLPNSTYYQVVTEHAIGVGTAGRLQSFQGRWSEVEATTGQTIAEVLDFDYAKMHRHHPVYGWYPGRALAPLIVINDGVDGAGRAVYFAGEFDRATCHAPLPGTLDALAQAVCWAAGSRPPVEVSSSPNIEVTACYSLSQRAYTVLLLNKTTNDLTQGMVVRYVEPLHEVTVTLSSLAGTVSEVSSLIGNPLTWHCEHDACRITLDRLSAYEALIITME